MRKMYTLEEMADICHNLFKEGKFKTEPRGLYEPVHHILSIPGKRIRPMLLLLSCDLFEGNIEQALNPAFAMEVFHNFTLVHDDIMDNADLRRGYSTIHKRFGLNAGILAGDLMLSYAYKYLVDIPPVFLPAVLAVFNQTAIEIYEGQQMDMDFETQDNVTVQEYLKMIEYKTSVFLAGSLQIGAILGNASIEDQHKIYQFGLNLGLSFQIKDDWLDAFGEGEKVGKKIGGDIIQNKKTYLLITAINDANETQKQELLEALKLDDKEAKVETVLNIFNTLDIKRKTTEKIDTLYQMSLDSLAALSVPNKRKQHLYSLAERIHERDS